MESEKDPKDNLNLEKYNKDLKNTGNTIYAVGWLTLIINAALFIWSLVDGNFSNYGIPAGDFSGTILFVSIASIFIILGNRIRKAQNDKDIKRYLKILLGLCVFILIWVALSGGRIGFLMVLVIIYLINSWRSINKAMINEDYKSSLIKPEHKINKKGWIILTVVVVLLFLLGLTIDLLMLDNSSPQQDQTTESAEQATNQENWQPYNSVDGSFEASFPATPEKETDSGEVEGYPYTTTFYSSETPSGELYAVFIYDYDIAPQDYNNNNGLEGALNGFLNGAKFKLENSNFSSYLSYDALDFVASSEVGWFKGKLFVKDDSNKIRIYAIIYGSPSENLPNYDRFLSSFKLK